MDTQPTTAIWRNAEPSFFNKIRYNYDDRTNQTPMVDKFTNARLLIVEYEGSKSGRGKQWIQPGSLFFERYKNNSRYIYIGKVVFVNPLRPRSDLCPALYELSIKRMPIGTVQPGDTLEKSDDIEGMGCYKKSALLACGYELDKVRKGANVCSGLNAIKIINN
jgi:hypothetical protein